MNQTKSFELIFDSPDPLEVEDLGQFLSTLSRLYSKLQLLFEGHTSYETYYRQKIPPRPKPAVRLTVTRIKYGSDLSFLVSGGDGLEFILLLELVKGFIKGGFKALVTHQRKHDLQEELRRYLMETSDNRELQNKIELFASKLGMTTDQLLEYVGDELSTLIEKRFTLRAIYAGVF